MLKEMFEGIANSPASNLTKAVDKADNIIEIKDVSILPSVPNTLVIGNSIDRETVKVTSKDGNKLTVEREYEGKAKAWNKGTVVARNFTNDDLTTIQDNIRMVWNKLNGIESGSQGPPGKSLEFDWRGTELGIRVEGDNEFEYVDLAGGGTNSTIVSKDRPPSPKEDLGYKTPTIWIDRTSGNIYVYKREQNNESIWAEHIRDSVLGGADDTTGSPGPKNLIAGNMDAGYFGTVEASKLFTGSELAQEVGIIEGTLQFNTVRWLKFAWKGDIVFRPQKSFRHSISWDAINAAGCVFGETKVSKGGITYSVELMQGALTNPSKYDDDDRGAMGSQWNILMLQIHEQAKKGDWDYPNYVEGDLEDWGIGFSNEDLHLHYDFGDGSRVWCQETSNDNSSSRVVRGSLGASGSLRFTSSTTNSNYGWAPVLVVSAH